MSASAVADPDGQQDGACSEGHAKACSQQDVQGQAEASACGLPGGTLSSADAYTQGRLINAGFPRWQALSMDPADRHAPSGKRSLPHIPVLQPANPNHVYFMARHMPGLRRGRPHSAPGGKGMTISHVKARCVGYRDTVIRRAGILCLQLNKPACFITRVTFV